MTIARQSQFAHRIDIRQFGRIFTSPRRLLLGCLLFDLVAGIFFGGLWLRRWAWRETEPVRYTSDINNAFVQGRNARTVGFLDYYDVVYRKTPDRDTFESDYAPGRLAVATLWSWWVERQVKVTPGPQPPPKWPYGFYQEARFIDRQDELCQPLLWFNCSMELIAAGGIYCLVRQWTAGRGRVKAGASAFVAATFFWLNPALIMDAHCWPQWDCWLMPFFIWALVAASNDRWLAAGMLIAVGAMFKTQILLGLPLFLLWPAFEHRWYAVARFAGAFLGGVALCTSPWLVRTEGHARTATLAYVIGVTVLSVIIVNRLTRAWPTRFALFMAAIGVALCSCIPFFDGSTAWFQVGVMSGARQIRHLPTPNIANLPSILAVNWHWQDMDPVVTVHSGALANCVGSLLALSDRRYAFSPGEPAPIPLRTLLCVGYCVGITLCAKAAANQFSRRDSRWLIAVTAAPWVVMMTLLPQIHERYLMWGAAMGAATVIVSPLWAAINIFISLVALNQMAVFMAHGTDPTLPINRFMNSLTPGVGWAMIAASVLYLIVGLLPRRLLPDASNALQVPSESGSSAVTCS